MQNDTVAIAVVQLEQALQDSRCACQQHEPWFMQEVQHSLHPHMHFGTALLVRPRMSGPHRRCSTWRACIILTVKE